MTRPHWFGRLVEELPALTFGPRGVTLPGPTPDARHSAVLILFGPGEHGPDLLLTRRSPHLRKHAGQVAFPGGRLDPGDSGPVAAALREAQEETGLDPSGVDVAAVGPPLFVSVTNFLVTPVLGWWRDPSPVSVVDPGEVDAVVRVPVADLVDPANRFTVSHPSGFFGPGFGVSGLFVWGFTAGVLAGLLELAGIAQEWDETVLRPVEEALPADETLSQTYAEQVPE